MATRRDLAASGRQGAGVTAGLARASTWPRTVQGVVAGMAGNVVVTAVIFGVTRAVTVWAALGGLYVLPVLPVGALWGLGAALITGLAGALIFCLSYWTAFVAPVAPRIASIVVIVVATAVVVSWMGERARRHATEAEALARQLQRIAEEQSALRRVATLVARGRGTGGGVRCGHRRGRAGVRVRLHGHEPLRPGRRGHGRRRVGHGRRRCRCRRSAAAARRAQRAHARRPLSSIGPDGQLRAGRRCGAGRRAGRGHALRRGDADRGGGPAVGGDGRRLARGDAAGGHRGAAGRASPSWWPPRWPTPRRRRS